MPDRSETNVCEVHKMYSFLRFWVHLNRIVVVRNFVKRRHKKLFLFILAFLYQMLPDS